MGKNDIRGRKVIATPVRPCLGPMRPGGKGSQRDFGRAPAVESGAAPIAANLEVTMPGNRNRPGDQSQTQNPMQPTRGGQMEREEQEEEETGQRREEESEESTSVQQQDRGQSNRGSPGNQGGQGQGS
jgi:hypothetical protein